MFRPFFFAMMAVVSMTSVAQTRTLTDEDLQMMATPLSEAVVKEKVGSQDILGVYHGAAVMVEYPCSDVCPAYTVRIISLQIPPDTCDRAGGVMLDVPYPMGISLGSRPYCVPRVLIPNKAYYSVLSSPTTVSH